MDDNSDDLTVDILTKLKKKHTDKIQIQVSDFNHVRAGMNPIRYHFYSIKSQFVAFCDGDDYWIDSNKST